MSTDRPRGTQQPQKIAARHKKKKYNPAAGVNEISNTMKICGVCEKPYDTRDNDKPYPGFPKFKLKKIGKCRDCK